MKYDTQMKATFKAGSAATGSNDEPVADPAIFLRLLPSSLSALAVSVVVEVVCTFLPSKFTRCAEGVETDDRPSNPARFCCLTFDCVKHYLARGGAGKGWHTEGL